MKLNIAPGNVRIVFPQIVLRLGIILTGIFKTVTPLANIKESFFLLYVQAKFGIREPRGIKHIFQLSELMYDKTNAKMNPDEN